MPVRNICPASLRVRSSRWKRHRKSGKKNPKTAAGRKKTAAVLQRLQLPTALLPLRYRQQARQPPMPPSATVRSVFPKGRLPTNPEDNIFEINLSRTIPSDARVWLCYELQGADHSGAVAKSINDRPATGGYMATASGRLDPMSARRFTRPGCMKASTAYFSRLPKAGAIRYATCMSKRHRDPDRHLRCHKLR